MFGDPAAVFADDSTDGLFEDSMLMVATRKVVRKSGMCIMIAQTDGVKARHAAKSWKLPPDFSPPRSGDCRTACHNIQGRASETQQYIRHYG
jgi:hypothetical protein